jgi:hypothetical protein
MEPLHGLCKSRRKSLADPLGAVVNLALEAWEGC